MISLSGSEFIEMDGFQANVGVIILAATNRPEVLDIDAKVKKILDAAAGSVTGDFLWHVPNETPPCGI